MNDEDEVVVEAPAHVTVPTDVEQAKAAHGAKVWTWIARIVGIALLAAILGAFVYVVVDSGNARAAARAERVELMQQLDEERARVDALYEQLRSLGEDPVVEPGGSKPEGLPGEQGPTGPQGVPGRDGRTPTAAEVLAAVTAYCASIGGCEGADGTPGVNGTNGIDGQDGAPGAPGAKGDKGDPGAAGVSIVSVTCTTIGDPMDLPNLRTAFRFTFSDGTTNDVPGPCMT